MTRWADWIDKYRKKEWCVVQVDMDSFYVIPTETVSDIDHIVIQDLTWKEAQMWKKIMS